MGEVTLKISNRKKNDRLQFSLEYKRRYIFDLRTMDEVLKKVWLPFFVRSVLDYTSAQSLFMESDTFTASQLGVPLWVEKL